MTTIRKNPATTGGIGHADRHWLLQSVGLTVVVIVLAIIFSLINPRFATLVNLANVLTQSSTRLPD